MSIHKSKASSSNKALIYIIPLLIFCECDYISFPVIHEGTCISISDLIFVVSVALDWLTLSVVEELGEFLDVA